MHDSIAVGPVQSVGNLGPVVQRLIGLQIQALCERFAFHVFHDQKIDAILAADIVKYADVWMIQARDDFGFALEALLAKGIGIKLRGQDLDRDGASKPSVGCALHFAHAACAERRDDLVRAQSRGGG